ncbi:MAG: PKD domain-containing protein [Bacteroidota bacterium]
MRLLIAAMALLAITLGGVGCQPNNLPPSVDDEVDFFVLGQIDGKAIKLEAGKEDYYMHTRRERSTDNIWRFQGTLSQTRCLDCPESFAIEIRDARIRPDNDGFDLGAVFKTKNYPFAFAPSLGPRLYQVNFQSQSSGGNTPLLQWTFGDGTTSNEANPTRFYEQIPGQRFEVCLQAADGGTCETQVCNDVILDIDHCQANFTMQIDTAFNRVRFENQSSGSGELSYQWQFGDGGSATIAEPTYFYSSSGRYLSKLSISDQDGCEATYSQQVSTDPDLCTHNFSYTISEATSPDSLQFGHVRVLWWDANGVLYRSDWSSQDGESRFQITEILDYDDNELGQPSIRLGLEIVCRLSNGDHEIVAKGLQAYLGVALPKKPF